MDWMILPNGLEYHLTGPAAQTEDARPVDVHMVAHQLAMINRFHGATTRPYSVAEHSLLCSEIARRAGAPHSLQMAMLWHDAHECVTNDVSSPAKRAVNHYSVQAGGTQAWTFFENHHAKRFRAAIGALTIFTAERVRIRTIDLMALATERRDLTAWREGVHASWPVLQDDEGDDLRIKPVDIDLNTPERVAMTWQDWRQAFIDRFDGLTEALRNYGLGYA